MLKFRPNHADSGQGTPRTARRRARWMVAGGVVAGSLVVGGSSLAGPPGYQGLAELNLALVARLLGGGDDGHDGNGGRRVPCDPDQLIAAINLANADGGGDLSLAPHCTYTLTAHQAGDGLPAIRQPVTLTGDDTSIVRAAGAALFRILHVGAGGDLTLHGLTVNGGQDRTGNGGGGLMVDRGGRATIEDSAFTHNSSSSSGGAIENRGTTYIRDSTISYNAAVLDGGGIRSSGFLALEDSRLTFNTARRNGGGLANVGNLTLAEKGTISNNNAVGQGGGVYASTASTTNTHDTTVSENTAGTQGGGIIAAAGTSLALRQTTVSRNTATGNGGGIFGDGTFVIEDGAITGNTTRGDGGGMITGIAANVTLRRSQVEGNNATGPNSVAGGIDNLGGVVTLTRTRVTLNTSTLPPGGVFTNNAGVTLDQESIIVANRPTNCAGSPVIPANCFG
jgi:predicted outer membrane repeat protein